MAERHTIIVRVEDGKVREILFCDCCPGVTLEVRTYTTAKRAVAAARPAWHMPEGDALPSKFQRDERGVYWAEFHEPEMADE